MLYLELLQLVAGQFRRNGAQVGMIAQDVGQAGEDALGDDGCAGGPGAESTAPTKGEPTRLGPASAACVL